MFRGRVLVFEIVLFIAFWIGSAIAMGLFIPHLKAEHIKRALVDGHRLFAG